jgi:hypothetical protein
MERGRGKRRQEEWEGGKKERKRDGRKGERKDGREEGRKERNVAAYS